MRTNSDGTSVPGLMSHSRDNCEHRVERFAFRPAESACDQRCARAAVLVAARGTSMKEEQ
jgi:hypothetical protein